MSDENVELVSRIFDGWKEGDFTVGSELLADDFEWHQRPDAVEPGVKRGSEIATGLKESFGVWADMRLVPEEFIDGGDKVIVLAQMTGTAKGSGMPLNQPFAFVWTIRDGRIVRNEMFGSREEALEAAGVSE